MKDTHYYCIHLLQYLSIRMDMSHIVCIPTSAKLQLTPLGSTIY